MAKWCDPDVYTGGANGNSGNDYANRQRDMGNVTSGAGVTTYVIKSPDPYRIQTLAGVNADAAFTKSSPTVTFKDSGTGLTANVIKIVNDATAAWTASANVTSTTTTFRKKGSTASQIAIAAAFTTGKAAYITTTTSDLSGCSKLMLWIQQSAGTAIPANTIRIRLCSDATGDVEVWGYTIPHALVVSGTGLTWTPIVFNNSGTAFGTGINSISIEILVDPGAVTFQVNNIAATSATGPTLQTLLTRSSTSTPLSWPIRSLDTSTAIIDFGISTSAASTSRGWWEASSVTSAVYAQAWTMTDTSQVIPSSGSSGNPAIWKGGMDSSGNQTGYSFIGYRGTTNTEVFLTSSKSDVTVERIIAVNNSNGIGFHVQSSTRHTLTSCGVINCTGQGANLSGSSAATDLTVTDFWNICSVSITLSGSPLVRVNVNGVYAYGGSNGAQFVASFAGRSTFKNITTNNCTTGFTSPAGGTDLFVGGITALDNATGLSVGGHGYLIADLTTSGNTSVLLIANLGVGTSDFGFINASIAESPSAWFSNPSAGVRVTFLRHAADKNDEREAIFVTNVTNTPTWSRTVAIASWAGTGYTPTGTHVYKLEVESNATSTLPAIQKWSLGRLPAGTYSLTLPVYRDNANVSGTWYIRGGYSPGVASDLSVSITASAGVSQTLSLPSFTLTDDCEVFLEFAGWITSGSTVRNIFMDIHGMGGLP
jgi:hypothetical protein